MKFERIFLIGFNMVARMLGVLATSVGIVFLVSAYALKENRALNIGAGIFAIVFGIASLLAKSVRAAQIARIRRSMGRAD